MTLRLDPHTERLIEQQLRVGRYHSPEEVVALALEALAERELPHSAETDPGRAVRDMLEFTEKHHFTLEGVRLKDLIHEGHKY